MKMGKVALAISGLVMFSVSSISLADNHTLSVGYAQSKVSDFKDIRGVNVQYRYEWDSPISVLGSFAYMTGDKSSSYVYSTDGSKNLQDNTDRYQADMKYYSFLVGPAWRINSYVSLYVLGGVAHVNAKENETSSGTIRSSSQFWKWRSTSFSYGTGVLINPIENLSVNIGYEGTSARECRHEQPELI